MPLREIATTWLRSTFAWSQSRESWRDRVVVVTLLLAAALLGWFTWQAGVVFTFSDGRRFRLSSNVLIALWSAWSLIALFLLASGRIKLFGPVLFYDMIRAARRTRYFLLRGTYCMILLLILYWVWAMSSYQQANDAHISSRLAEAFFEAFTVTQLIAVTLLTPAYVAGAISEEKDRKTLEFLLATDLLNREIVFSKYLSRLANLTLFLLTGLPILSMLQFLGGVDPNLVMASFAFTIVTMLGLGGISILNSVMYKRPRDSIAITYLFIIGYIALSTALFQVRPPAAFMGGMAPASWDEHAIEFLYSGNIFVVLAKVYQAGSAGTLATSLPGILGEYTIFYGGLAVVCIAWSTLRLRRIALKQTFGTASKSLKSRGRAPVTELPMLWKEIHVEGSLKLNWMTIFLLALLVLATFANPFLMLTEISILGVGNHGMHHNLAQEMNIWVRIAGTFVACLTILGVAIRAANSISVERDRQSFDCLLTTPLDSSSILAAKFLGSLASVRLGWVWLGLIYVIGLLTGGMHLFAFPLVIAAWFVYACAAGIIGLWFSMVCHTTLRATVYTVLTCVGLGVGHWVIWLCCGPLLFMSGGGDGSAGEYLAKFQAGLTPPFVLGVLAFHGEELRSDFGGREFAQMLGFSLFGLFVWALASLLFWNGVMAPRFRTLTGRDDPDEFDEPRRPPRRRRRDVDESDNGAREGIDDTIP